MKIDFFVAGVQKSGTTALDSFLRQHPRIQMAKVKEVHFFDNEYLDWSNPDYGALHANFSWDKTDQMRGEATPIYTYWPNSLERLRDYNPGAKLIIGLRHPTYRAYSHWRMEIGRHTEDLEFVFCVTAKGRARVNNAPNGVHRVHSYVERSHYTPQIERLLTLFPRNQIYFFKTDDLWQRTDGLIHDIHAFLGLEPHDVPTKGYVAPAPPTMAEPMSEDVKSALHEKFYLDILAIHRLTGLAVDDWLDFDYKEPMTHLY